LIIGVRKFIIHSRKCFLNGLTPKQNRDIPPLQYDVVHRLVKEFPDLTFVLNGGITTLQDTDAHLFPAYADGMPPVHGIMIGRAAYSDPFILSQVDSLYYNTKDPCLTRREVMDRYLSYCDHMQSSEGPVKSFKGKVSPISPSFLIRAVHNAFVGCDGCSKYKTALNDVYDKHRKEEAFPTARFVVCIKSPVSYVLSDLRWLMTYTVSYVFIDRRGDEGGGRGGS
jgi:tRNA-dihydrouridine synthase